MSVRVMATSRRRGGATSLWTSFSTDGVWRAVASVGASTGAVVHLLLWADGFKTIPKIGPLFLLDVIAGFVVALFVVASRHWLSAATVVLFGAGTLAAFFMSVAFGLFGVHETIHGTPQLTALIAEAVAVLAGIVLLVRDRMVSAR